eukprot:10069655-Alexandrium_andersonii.AAC.1
MTHPMRDAQCERVSKQRGKQRQKKHSHINELPARIICRPFGQTCAPRPRRDPNRAKLNRKEALWVTPRRKDRQRKRWQGGNSRTGYQAAAATAAAAASASAAPSSESVGQRSTAGGLATAP